MQRIFQLEPHIADLIAAGEVVERPASVVKELMENSIDAGASIITVEIKNGGMTYIRVSDDGAGIAPDDVETAFKRFATSKVRTATELEAIGTLGFRGEALAAIAAVSRIELTTRERGIRSSEGVRLSLEASVQKYISPVGAPEGTTIIVRDLFFNTPARKKFMKSNRTEGAAVASAVIRCALSHPGISVRFIKDGKSEYHTPGDSRADSCIYSLFGREFSSGLLAADLSDDNHSIRVSGYVSGPNASRGNRSFQFYIVNGRPIRSRMLYVALEQAYANILTTGRFPSCILYITTRLSDVDVNIHPTKADVKFVSEKHVYSAVYYAARGALENTFAENAQARDEPGTKSLFSENKSVQGRKEPMSTSVSDSDYKHGNYKTRDNRHKAPAQIILDQIVPIRKQQSYEVINESFKPLFSSVDEDIRIYDNSTPLKGVNKGAHYAPYGQDDSQTSFKVVGEALKTYIIIEDGETLKFIDKHAAHERIRFNALKSNNYEPMSQALIIPVICRLGVENMSILLDNAGLLDTLGFSIESFGEDSVAVRLIPADIDVSDIDTVLSEICEHLMTGSFIDSERLDGIYRTIACGSSIKAGAPSSLEELEELAGRVLSGEITHCPHGRPVMFELTKTLLEKEFKRI